MKPQRHFLDERQPLARQAAEWLLARAEDRGGCIDLGDWGVIVPTAESGRRLSVLLTVHSSRKAVLLPRILTPVQVLRGPGGAWGEGTDPTQALESERMMAWCEVLAGLDFKETSERWASLFPAVPPVQDFAWARGVARLLMQTQNSLMEAGHSLGAVSRQVADLREPERWAVLAELEKRYRTVLHGWGLRDPGEAWEELLEKPAWDPSVSHWVVLAVPDPIPMVCRVLENSGRPVHCVIHAAEDRADDFDAWGRPEPGVWSTRVQPFREPEKTLHLQVSESGQAAVALRLVQGHRERSAVVVGIGREETLPLLRRAFSEAGLPVFDPSGRPAAGHEVVVLLRSLQELLGDRSLRALRSLVVHPAGWRALVAADDRGFLEGAGPRAALEALDLHETRHLSRTLDEVLNMAGTAMEDAGRQGPDRGRNHEKTALAGALSEAAQTWCARLDGQEPGALENLGLWLRAAYADGGELDEDGVDLAGELDAWVGRVSPLMPRLRHLSVSHLLHLWVEALAGKRLGEKRPTGAVEMKGWLELSWEDRPHLVICGLQEGAVPLALTGDVFLPESLRAALGLRTSSDLLARDAFLLHGLLQSREGSGRVDVLLSKFTDAGEPLRPSRLLLQTTDEALPARVASLFGEPTESSNTPAPTRLFSLQLPDLPPGKKGSGEGKKISVTHFSEFLQSPLYFHLLRVLKWEEYPADKREMDPLDFGDLAHAVLEDWGREDALTACMDAAVLKKFFDQEVRKRAKWRFGKTWPLGVEVQVEALIQRLGRFAELQVVQAGEGWRVQEVEKAFAYELAGWTVRGKIDRIDVHPDGRVRLLDYKTSETAKDPEKAHWKDFKRAASREHYPGQAWMERGKYGGVWLNLQLPLYMAYWRQQEGVERLECGYIQLPNSLDSVEFSLWNNFGPEWESGAVSCACSVLAALDAGCREVIPSADCWKSEPWSVWLPGGPEVALAEVAT